MYKRVFLLAVLLLLVSIIAAQDDSTITYISQDGAVQFEYSTDWMFNFEIPQYNVLYSYDFMVPMVTDIEDVPRDNRQSKMIVGFPIGNLSDPYYSTIRMAIVNPSTAEFLPELDTLEEYAEMTTGASLEDANELEIAGYPALRVADTDIYLREHVGRAYFIMRDDGWLISVKLSIPQEYIERQDELVQTILETLVFDDGVAAEPFERNLEAYDYSNVELSKTFTYSDGCFTVEYPEDWEAIEPDPRFVSPPTQVQFTVLDDNVEITVLIVSIAYTGGMTPQSIMEQRRNVSQDIAREFLIDDKEAVSIDRWVDKDTFRQVVSFALNDAWLAEGLIDAESEEIVSNYETTLVAMLASLEYIEIQTIETISELNTQIPENWVIYQMDFQHGAYYQTILIPVEGSDLPDVAISIMLLNLDATGWRETVNLEGVDGFLSAIATLEGELETLVVADYEIIRGQTSYEGNDYVYMDNVFLISDDWLVFAEVIADTVEESESFLPLIDSMIEEMELNVEE